MFQISVNVSVNAQLSSAGLPTSVSMPSCLAQTNSMQTDTSSLRLAKMLKKRGGGGGGGGGGGTVKTEIREGLWEKRSGEGGEGDEGGEG